MHFLSHFGASGNHAHLMAVSASQPSLVLWSKHFKNAGGGGALSPPQAETSNKAEKQNEIKIKAFILSPKNYSRLKVKCCLKKE